MSKLCKHCGAEMDDEAFECPECRTKIPGAEMLFKQKQIEKRQKLKKNLTIAGIVVLAIAFITGITIAVKSFTKKASDEYMKPVEDYIEGCVANDFDLYISAFPEYYRTFFAEQYAYIVMGEIVDDKEKIHTAAMLYHDQYYRELTARYGLNFDINYKIHSEARFTPEELARYESEYRSFYEAELGSKTFEDGYKITVTFTPKGNLGVKDITKQDFMLCKIDGQWYMMSYVDFLEEEEEPDIENYK
ncbi:MAG: hypothetical protein E7505_09545 [Ruminococcus sp.]|nr:hypothetical protein [Ruminococcus sp.]